MFEDLSQGWLILSITVSVLIALTYMWFLLWLVLHKTVAPAPLKQMSDGEHYDPFGFTADKSASEQTSLLSSV